MSLNTATKEQLKELIQYISDNICLPIIGVGGGDAPIGKMGMFDAIVAPQGWLIADGSEYNIDDYPELATHIASTHGSMNYYGGNGTTTFAVPDWQGEFFRASGTNAHTNQGDGANPGVHQDATEIPQTGFESSKSSSTLIQNSTTIDNPTAGTWAGLRNRDSAIKGTNLAFAHANSDNQGIIENNTQYVSGATTRPTNTSLLCCIKATPQGHQYSEKEQIVGSWIDGKPIYEKTINFGALPNKSVKSVQHNISNFSELISLSATIQFTDGFWRTLNMTQDDNNSMIATAQVTSSVVQVLARNIDFSGYHKCYITIRYTKTTD